ncbi:MAG: hypothetical protein ACI38Q_06245 [Candidatus Bruticola sp.]
MEQGRSYNLDDGWSKPCLPGSVQNSSSDSRAASKKQSQAGKIARPQVSGLRAKINARLEAERNKGSSQGGKSDSQRGNNQNQEESFSGSASSLGNFSPQTKFNNNRLFGITLLAPGLSEDDSEAISALDKTISDCLVSSHASESPAVLTPDINSELGSSLAVADDNLAPIAGISESKVSENCRLISTSEFQHVEAEQLQEVEEQAELTAKYEERPVVGAAENIAVAAYKAGGLQPYIPGRRLSAEGSVSGQAEKENPSLSSAFVEKSVNRTEVQHRSSDELKPYIPGLGYRQSGTAESATSRSAYHNEKVHQKLEAPGRGTGNISVYTAPVSASDLAASASKNSVLPLPVIKGRKGTRKNEAEVQDGLNDEVLSEPGSERAASLSEQLDEFCSESSGSEGRSLLQKLKEVRPAKRRPPVMRL